MHFNTSYVVIKRIQYPSIDDYDKYFNTSYVVIKLYCLIVVLKTTYNFNTSYVVIKLQPLNTSLTKLKKFQYILCCY